MQLLCIGLYGEANLASRESLLMNEASVEIKDDMGQLLSFHPDWEENTYIEIIQSFSEKDDYVYLPRIVTGKNRF